MNELSLPNVCATVANAIEAILQSRKNDVRNERKNSIKTPKIFGGHMDMQIGIIVNTSIVCWWSGKHLIIFQRIEKFIVKKPTNMVSFSIESRC